MGRIHLQSEHVVGLRLSIVESLRRKADLLAVGLYPSSKGYVIALAKMQDTHLVNALLKALEQQEPAEITEPLAAEVSRRNLNDYAQKIAQERTKR